MISTVMKLTIVGFLNKMIVFRRFYRVFSCLSVFFRNEVLLLNQLLVIFTLIVVINALFLDTRSCGHCIVISSLQGFLISYNQW